MGQANSIKHTPNGMLPSLRPHFPKISHFPKANSSWGLRIYIQEPMRDISLPNITIFLPGSSHGSLPAPMEQMWVEKSLRDLGWTRAFHIACISWVECAENTTARAKEELS